LLYDKPLRYLYYLKKNIDINNIKVQKEEVDHVKYMSVEEINQLIEEKQILESHGIMFQKLMNNLNNK